MSRSPVSYHHGNLREALLNSADQLLREKGPEGISLRAVARQAGVSQTAPYRHFSDKDELLAGVAEIGFTRMHENMWKLGNQFEDFGDRLKALGLGYITFALGNPNLFRLMFGTLRARSEEVPDLKTACDEGYEVLLGTIREGQSAGVFREGDVELLAVAAWSQVHGMAHLAIDGVLEKKRPGESLEELAESVGELVLSGLHRPEARG